MPMVLHADDPGAEDCEGGALHRAVHVSSVHPLGDTRILHKEARALQGGKYSVSLIARGSPSNVGDGITAIGVRLPNWRPARVLAAPGVILAVALKQSASVYHLHDPEILFVGVVLKCLTRARIIFDVHENIPAQIESKHWIPRLLRKPSAMAYRAIERLLLPRYDALVLAEDSYLPLYAWHPRVSVIHNYPLRIENLAPPRNQGSAVRVVYVGGISQARGAMTMLEAASIVKRRGISARWTLIGHAGSRSLNENMHQFVRDAGLESEVQLVGPRPFAEAQAEIARSDIGVSVLAPIPNYVESLPTKLLEYMMAGIPAIASDFPLWRSLLERFECGIVVPPLDPQALAEAVERLAVDGTLRHAMGSRGHNGLIDAGMTWDHEAKRLVALYEELVAP